jgi:hypothetical protein
VLKKPISNQLKHVQNLIFGLLLTVFIYNISTNTFAKDFQQSAYVCELDEDADELDEESFVFFGIYKNLEIPFAWPSVSQILTLGNPTSTACISKSFSLHLERKRPLVLKNLKLFC